MLSFSPHAYYAHSLKKGTAKSLGQLCSTSKINGLKSVQYSVVLKLESMFMTKKTKPKKGGENEEADFKKAYAVIHMQTLV